MRLTSVLWFTCLLLVIYRIHLIVHPDDSDYVMRVALIITEYISFYTSLAITLASRIHSHVSFIQLLGRDVKDPLGQTEKTAAVCIP